MQRFSGLYFRGDRILGFAIVGVLFDGALPRSFVCEGVMSFGFWGGVMTRT